MKFQAIVQIVHEDDYHYPSHWNVGDRSLGPRRDTVEEAVADFISNRSPEMERKTHDEEGRGHDYRGYYIQVFTEEDMAKEAPEKRELEESQRRHFLDSSKPPSSPPRIYPRRKRAYDAGED